MNGIQTIKMGYSSYSEDKSKEGHIKCRRKVSKQCLSQFQNALDQDILTLNRTKESIMNMLERAEKKTHRLTQNRQRRRYDCDALGEYERQSNTSKHSKHFMKTPSFVDCDQVSSVCCGCSTSREGYLKAKASKTISEAETFRVTSQESICEISISGNHSSKTRVTVKKYSIDKSVGNKYHPNCTHDDTQYPVEMLKNVEIKEFDATKYTSNSPDRAKFDKQRNKQKLSEEKARRYNEYIEAYKQQSKSVVKETMERGKHDGKDYDTMIEKYAKPQVSYIWEDFDELNDVSLENRKHFCTEEDDHIQYSDNRNQVGANTHHDSTAYNQTEGNRHKAKSKNINTAEKESPKIYNAKSQAKHQVIPHNKNIENTSKLPYSARKPAYFYLDWHTDDLSDKKYEFQNTGSSKSVSSNSAAYRYLDNLNDTKEKATSDYGEETLKSTNYKNFKDSKIQRYTKDVKGSHIDVTSPRLKTKTLPFKEWQNLYKAVGNYMDTIQFEYNTIDNETTKCSNDCKSSSRSGVTSKSICSLEEIDNITKYQLKDRNDMKTAKCSEKSTNDHKNRILVTSKTINPLEEIEKITNFELKERNERNDIDTFQIEYDPREMTTTKYSEKHEHGCKSGITSKSVSSVANTETMTKYHSPIDLETAKCSEISTNGYKNGISSKAIYPLLEIERIKYNQLQDREDRNDVDTFQLKYDPTDLETAKCSDKIILHCSKSVEETENNKNYQLKNAKESHNFSARKAEVLTDMFNGTFEKMFRQENIKSEKASSIPHYDEKEEIKKEKRQLTSKNNKEHSQKYNDTFKEFMKTEDSLPTNPDDINCGESKENKSDEYKGGSNENNKLESIECLSKNQELFSETFKKELSTENSTLSLSELKNNFNQGIPQNSAEDTLEYLKGILYLYQEGQLKDEELRTLTDGFLTTFNNDVAHSQTSSTDNEVKSDFTQQGKTTQEFSDMTCKDSEDFNNNQSEKIKKLTTCSSELKTMDKTIKPEYSSTTNIKAAKDSEKILSKIEILKEEEPILNKNVATLKDSHAKHLDCSSAAEESSKPIAMSLVESLVDLDPNNKQQQEDEMIYFECHESISRLNYTTDEDVFQNIEQSTSSFNKMDENLYRTPKLISEILIESQNEIPITSHENVCALIEKLNFASTELQHKRENISQFSLKQTKSLEQSKNIDKTKPTWNDVESSITLLNSDERQTDLFTKNDCNGCKNQLTKTPSKLSSFKCKYEYLETTDSLNDIESNLKEMSRKSSHVHVDRAPFHSSSASSMVCVHKCTNLINEQKMDNLDDKKSYLILHQAVEENLEKSEKYCNSHTFNQDGLLNNSNNCDLRRYPAFRHCPCMLNTHLNIMKIYNRRSRSPLGTRHLQKF